ncbi:hypothetical protein MFIFM68171_09747 [Madurella fahalii]|uniref:Uncharacterized protein n=1 Tax=Madurella fahalii TaxID=1157608 RepID=A0ABQ0GP76_9PEZI
MTSDLSALPAAPASPGSECYAELVFKFCSFAQMANAGPSQVSLDVSTVEEIIDYIVSARQRGSESLIGFHWQASKVHDLSEQLDARLLELDEPKIQRFEYDYESETVYLDFKGKSEFHYQVRAGLRRYIENRIAELSALATMYDPEIRRLIGSISERGAFLMEYEGKICKQADASFGPARQYINSSDGKIRAVLILDLQYPSMQKASVSLLAADDSSSHWIQHHELYHDDHLDQQPAEQVDLYLSDFVGLAGLPETYCRPSTAELAAGTTRNPMITRTFERLRPSFAWLAIDTIRQSLLPRSAMRRKTHTRKRSGVWLKSAWNWSGVWPKSAWS